MENRWDNNEFTRNKFSTYSDTVKLLIQGVPFAVSSIVFTRVLSFIELDLLFLNPNLFFTLIGGLLILFLVIIGLSNTLLAEILWDIRPNRSIFGFIGQGVLFAVLISFFSPISLVINIALSFSLWLDAIGTIISVIIMGYIGGYLGKNIAAEFEPTVARTEELASIHDRHVMCPHCNVKFIATPTDADESGGTNCPECRSWLSIFDRGPSL